MKITHAGPKRAQAALEFLTTYGWAFLVILVMISALSYFGVLNPDRFLPEKCIFGSGLGACTEIRINTTHVSFKLVNGMGNSLILQSINMTNVQGVTAATCTGLNSTAGTTVSVSGAAPALVNGILWPSGQVAEFMFPCVVALGERLESTPVIIQYKTGAGTYINAKEGDISVKRTTLN